MATPARSPSEIRNRSTLISLSILLSLQPGTRTGTTEIQQRLAERGLPVSLRTVQRHLIDLSAVLPIEADGERPQGWRWAKTTEAATLSRLVGGAA